MLFVILSVFEVALFHNALEGTEGPNLFLTEMTAELVICSYGTMVADLFSLTGKLLKLLRHGDCLS